MIPAPCAYLRPGTVEEALAALADPEARPIAGGHSLVPMMKLRLARPTLLVDLAALGLRGIRADSAGYRIGAMTTYDDLLLADGEARLPDALRECVAAVGDRQVRNAGTIGGALAHADPASDIAAGVIALGAVLRLRSAAGVRDCAAESFFLGPFAADLARQELLEEIVIPRSRAGESSAYVSVEDKASGYPLAGAAVRVDLADGRATSCTVGLTGLGAHPHRLPALEQALLTGDDLDAAVSSLEPAAGDIEDDAYRRSLAAVVAQRAYATACERVLP